jgi:hypothetical protein
MLPRTSISNQLSVIFTNVIALADAVTSTGELRLPHLRACNLNMNGYEQRALTRRAMRHRADPQKTRHIIVILHIHPILNMMLMHVAAASPTAPETHESEGPFVARRRIIHMITSRRQLMLLAKRLHTIIKIDVVLAKRP